MQYSVKPFHVSLDVGESGTGWHVILHVMQEHVCCFASSSVKEVGLVHRESKQIRVWRVSIEHQNRLSNLNSCHWGRLALTNFPSMSTTQGQSVPLSVMPLSVTGGGTGCHIPHLLFSTSATSQPVLEQPGAHTGQGLVPRPLEGSTITR